MLPKALHPLCIRRSKSTCDISCPEVHTAHAMDRGSPLPVPHLIPDLGMLQSNHRGNGRVGMFQHIGHFGARLLNGSQTHADGKPIENILMGLSDYGFEACLLYTSPSPRD